MASADSGPPYSRRLLRRIFQPHRDGPRVRDQAASLELACSLSHKEPRGDLSCSEDDAEEFAAHPEQQCLEYTTLNKLVASWLSMQLSGVPSGMAMT